MTLRLLNNAPPGSLLKSYGVMRDARYLRVIRSLPCLVCAVNPGGEAAHVRFGSKAGMGRKPSDWRSLPMCHAHHMEQHNSGEKVFWDSLNIDVERVMAELAKSYPDAERMRQVVLMNAVR